MTTEIKRIHVLQIVGDPVGGIRKHVHSIIGDLNQDTFLQSYSFSVISQDKIFLTDIKKLSSFLYGLIPLKIKKQPHISDLTNLIKLVNYCKKNHVDIIHGHGAKGGLYARIVSLICAIPSIYTPHGGVAHPMFGYLHDRFYIFVEKVLARFTAHYIFESKYTAESFFRRIGEYKRPWIVNHNGIKPCLDSDKLFQKKNSNYIINIGVFGMLRKEKGQMYLINSIDLLINSGVSHVRLHVFGDGPDFLKLISLVNEKCLNKFVTFYGDISNVEEEMLKMDIVAIPSIFESFGYVGLEAMCLGKPVIASAVGGLKEIFDDNTALFVIPEDEVSIKKAIEKLIFDNALMAKLGVNGRKRCLEVFSFEKMLNIIEQTYKKVH
jgi:glycosyltransferase involved in cell wall biosynthesis